jgi:hypothetical protein
VNPIPQVRWAVAVILGTNLLFLILFALVPIPGDENVPAAAVIVGNALSIASVALCWWLWRMKRWAVIAVTAILIFNMLSALPGLLNPPSAVIASLILLGIPAALIPVWLLWQRGPRSAYQ